MIADTSLSSPFQPQLPYETFKEKCNYSETTTEKSNEITAHLSDVMQEKGVVEGMKLLLEVDKKVLEGFEQFIPQIDAISSELAQKIANSGRILTIGSGSSGRVGVTVAALCNKAFPQSYGVIQGMLAGGDSTMVKPRENFEDNDKAGKELIESLKLGENDTLFLISASGSAPFNVGAGHAAANALAKVYYFYNSTTVQEQTQTLFKRQNNPVIPLCIDIGPQAIAGSTRLQAATLANCCLGALFVTTLYKQENNTNAAATYPSKLLDNMQHAITLIGKNLETIAKFAEIQQKIFSHPLSNFIRKPADPKATVGYVTFVADPRTIQTVFIDATESSPTFSLPPMLRENEANKLLPTYAAYIACVKNNDEAWRELLGREVTKADIEHTSNFILAKNEAGTHSWQNRPTGENNLVIGVSSGDSPAVAGAVLTASKVKAATAFILLSEEQIPEANKRTMLSYSSALLCYDNLPKDPTGFSQSILLKLTLNLISNSAMTLAGKVEGNLMTDVRAANNKLIARVMHLLKERWKTYEGNTPFPVNDAKLYELLLKRMEEKKADPLDTTPIVKDLYQRLKSGSQ